MSGYQVHYKDFDIDLSGFQVVFDPIYQVL